MVTLAGSFDVVESSVTAYLEQYPHWPVFHELVKEKGGFVRYVLRPDAEDPDTNNCLGFIDLSMAPGSTLIEFGEPYAERRNWTDEEVTTFRRREIELIQRYKPADFDPRDADQYAALERRVRLGMELARREIETKIIEEQQARKQAYYRQLDEVKRGLRTWLQTRGIGEEDNARQLEDTVGIKGSSSTTERDLPPRPSREGDFAKWKKVYRLIGPQLKTKSIEDVIGWLKRMHPTLPRSRQTLSKIIAWGEAGEL